MCFSSETLVWLRLSLPSEITTIAFLRLWPVSASGTASATASYIAVPPRGHDAIENAAQEHSVRRPVLHEHRVVAEAIEKYLVLWLEQVQQETVERLDARSHFSPAMLVLVSSTRPRLTGTRSALKCVTCCGTPSS